MKLFRILLVQVALVCCNLGYSKGNIDGVYYDSTGMKLVVCQKKFVAIDEARGDSSPVVYASYSWEDMDFVKLRSRHFKKIHKNKIVKKIHSRMSCDSVSIGFKFPDSEKYDFDVYVLCEFATRNTYHSPAFESYEFTYSNDSVKNRINIPRKTKYMQISVKSKFLKPLSADSLSGYYNGFKIYSMAIRMRKRIQSIEIEIPELDYWFSHQYVDGEYVMVDGDKLYWRGRVFKKSARLEDAGYMENK